MRLTLLWTDIMVWLLLFAITAWGYLLSKSPQVRKQWITIFKSPIALASSIILLCYLLFALIDSVHFKLEDRNSVVSLLDMAFKHRVEHKERTYSAPFALTEYTKDISMQGGSAKQIYRPLKYVHEGNFISNSWKALIVGGAISLLLILTHMRWRRKGGKSEIPWGVGYITVTLLLILISWL